MVVAVSVVSLALAFVATVFAVLNLDTPTPPNISLGSKFIEVVFPSGALVLVGTGALIALRQPGHPIAWCFLLLGLGAEALVAVQNYGLFGTATAPGAVPGAGFSLWVSSWFWSVPATALTLTILLFPDGRLLSARWRPVAWMTVIAVALQSSADALRIPVVAPDMGIESPLGTPFPVDALANVALVGTLVWVMTMLAAGASLVLRFRRARGIERQQLKWFAYATTVGVILMVVSSLTYPLPDVAPVTTALSVIALLLIPVAASIAILRHRLYDIDLVIERTLVYGAVSTTLAVTYLAAVVTLQGLLRPITGASEVSVALSTLLVIALFHPIRRRAQRIVDRRFYRARYDAARTIDAFSVRLRGDVDLDSLRTDLIATIDDTVRPRHASLWLRELVTIPGRARARKETT